MQRSRAHATAVAARAWVGLVTVVLMITACSPWAPSTTPSGTRPPSPSTPVSATPQPTPTRSATAPTPKPTSGRPLQEVPAVKPPGFVAPPRGSGFDRYLDQPVTWAACDRLQCARVRVPLDWSKPDGQAITLKLAKKSATASPRLGSLFVNPGGPGGSGVALAANFRQAGLEQYDVIGWDPRGSGGSTPVVCEDDRGLDAYYAADNSPDDAAEDRSWLEANTRLGRSCLEHSGALLQHISTLDTVKDLDFLRQLLGDEKLTFFGYSYGTEIGAVYAHTYPKRVGRMVLDGAVDITGDDSVTQAEGFDRSIGAYAEWCAGRFSCRLGGSKAAVQKSIVKLLVDLDRKPIAVGQRSLTQSLAATGVFEALYFNESAYPYLTSALVNARNGRGAELLALADEYTQRNSDGSYNAFFTSYLAISCTEESGTVAAARSRAARAAKDAPVLGPFFGVDYTCTQWPVAPAPALPRLTARGAAPIVVIGTTGDPATPYEQAVSMAKQLDSGVLVTLQGEGHTAYGRNDCINQVVTRYLTGGSVPDDGTRCG